MQPQIRERLAVVVREGLKGNHLLFGEPDLTAALGCADEGPDGRMVVDPVLAGELGTAGLQLVQVGSIQDARTLIGGLSPACRMALARLYLRFLARCAATRGHAN